MAEDNSGNQTTEQESFSPLNPSRFNGADFERAVYVATVEQGTSKETMCNPGFWAHIAARVRPWDRIEARCDDGTFLAEFIILSAGRNWVKVHLLSYVSLTSSDVSMTQAAQQEYSIKFMGPHKKWSVLKPVGSKSEYVQEGFASEDEARGWLRDHIKAIG